MLENRFVDPEVEENLKTCFKTIVPAGYGVVCILTKDTQLNVITNIADIGVQYALNHALKQFDKKVDN